jgi:hypothetical protein
MNELYQVSMLLASFALMVLDNIREIGQTNRRKRKRKRKRRRSRPVPGKLVKVQLQKA